MAFKYGKGTLPKKGGKSRGMQNQNQRRQLDALLKPGSPPTAATKPKPRRKK
jgi:hypothetical protein